MDEVLGANPEGIPGSELPEGRQLIATLLLIQYETGKSPVAIYDELQSGVGKVLSEKLKIPPTDALHGPWTQRLLKFAVRSGFTLQGDIPTILHGLEFSLEALPSLLSEIVEAQGVLQAGKSRTTEERRKAENAKKILLTLFLEKGKSPTTSKIPPPGEIT
jgi:hypothetical protein